MYLSDRCISNEGIIPMGRIVGMLPWNLVLRQQRVVSVENVTCVGKLAM